MPVPLLAGAFSLTVITGLVVKVLVAFGVTIVSYTGATYALTSAQAYFDSQMAQLPSDMLAILNIMGVSQGIAVYFAGVSAYLTIQATFGAFTRFKLSPPGGGA